MSGVATKCSPKLGGALVPCGLIRSSLGLSGLVPNDSRAVTVLQSGSEVASKVIDYVADEISCNSGQDVTVLSVMLLGRGSQVGFSSQFSVGDVVLIGDANIVKYVGVEVFSRELLGGLGCWWRASSVKALEMVACEGSQSAVEVGKVGGVADFFDF